MIFNIFGDTYIVHISYEPDFILSSLDERRIIAKGRTDATMYSTYKINSYIKTIVGLGTAYRNVKDRCFIKKEGRKRAIKNMLYNGNFTKEFRSEFWKQYFEQTHERNKQLI
jgi:hypothetical protein